jgi:hypothetical protein
MSITAIAHQAQGMRAGEVIAKLAEDAYFMRLDNRVTQAPPSGTATTKPQAAVWTSVVTVLERSYQLTPIALRQRPTDPLKVATALAPQAAIARSFLTATLAAGAPTMELAGGPGRRRSRRPRPREQPRLRSLTWRLQRPPEN